MQIRKTQIESLRAIASDESISQELRDAAREQLRELDEVEPAKVQPQAIDNTPPPTKDFIEFRLRPIWETLPEGKLAFERWLRTPDVRERVRRHDAWVNRDAAEAEHRDESYLREQLGWDDDSLIQTWGQMMKNYAESQFSWVWQHTRLSNSDYLTAMRRSDYELRGQEQCG